MPELVLRFVSHTDLATDAIARGQLGVRFPSHVEVVQPDGRLFGARIQGGVMSRAPDYDAMIWERQHIIHWPCTLGQLAAINSNLKSQDGKPYDTEAIVAMAAGAFGGVQRDWRQADSWLCSELLPWSIEGTLIHPLPVGVSHITPLAFYLIVGAMVQSIGAPVRRI